MLVAPLVTFSLVLPACTSKPARPPTLLGLRSHASKIDQSYIGDWTGSDGTTYIITAASDDSMVINVSKPGETTPIKLKGRIIPIDGVRFSEIEIPAPPVVVTDQNASAQNGQPLPVFAYARFKPTLTSLEYSPIDAAWLKHQVENNPDASYWSGEGVAAGSGGIAVRSPALMFDLLRKASKDQAAFATTEVLTKSK